MNETARAWGRRRGQGDGGPVRSRSSSSPLGWRGMLVALFAAGLLCAACSEPSDNGGDDGKPADKDAGKGADGAGPGDAGGAGSDGGAVDTHVPPPAEDFWVIYGRSSRIPNAPDTDNDLVVTDRVNPGAIDNAGTWGCGISPFGDNKSCIELTKYAFKKAKGLTCNFGCIMAPSMKYIAISEGPPDKDGLFTYRPGTIEYYPTSATKFLFIVDKFEPIKAVRDLHFAGPYLYYSTPIQTFKTGVSQYEIRRRNMVDFSEGEKVITVMAPSTDPDANPAQPHTTYSGRFHVSEDGETLVFLTPTIRSMKVWSWSAGNLTQHDYICESPLDENTCVGTGSQYDDNDAVGISPDGKTIVLFTIVGRYFRVRKYKVGSAEGSTFTNLITVPAGGGYLQNVCLNLPTWLHAEVTGRPQFSADGKTIYFVGVSRCGGTSEKEWTDIMSIPAAAIGGPIGQADVTNYTNNPRESTPSNRWVRSMTLSPEKKYFVFNASPTYGSSGDPIRSLTDKRQLKDTEIYVMPTQPGAEMLQITNEGAYDAHAPFPVKPLSN